MTEFTGSARLRRAIENQASAGEASFTLPIGEASAICDECEDQLAALSWAEGVTAPVDADGEVVPLDTEVLYREDGGKCKVAYWAYYPNEKDGWTAVSDVMGTKRACIPKTLHLTPHDSWEKLEEDMKQFENGGSSCSYFNGESTSCDGCRSPYPIGGNCRNAVVGDIFRRAKALAERDVKASTPHPSHHGAKEANRG